MLADKKPNADVAKTVKPLSAGSSLLPKAIAAPSIAEFKPSCSPAKVAVLAAACSAATLVPVILASRTPIAEAFATIMLAAVTFSFPKISIISIASKPFASRFAIAPAAPTMEGLKFWSASFSSVKRTFLNAVPASAPFISPIASVWIAAVVCSNDKPKELATEPALAIASDVAAMLEEPYKELAARILIYLSASSAPSLNWFNEPARAIAASVRSMPAASASVTALRVTEFNASPDARRSGFADAISWKASAACDAERVVVAPISKDCFFKYSKSSPAAPVMADRFAIAWLKFLELVMAFFITVPAPSARRPPTRSLTFPEAFPADLAIGSMPFLAASSPFLPSLTSSSFAALTSRVSTDIFIVAKSMLFFDLNVSQS